VFNLADTALMSESAVSVVSSLGGARRDGMGQGKANPDTHGRMIRGS
jgi:hypothetical protein